MKVRPHPIGKRQLGIGALPEQEVGEPLLAPGADHEVYVVTVRGSFTIPFTGRGGPGFPRVHERTYEVDAATGQIGLTGGKPLPLGTPGVVMFRSD